VSDSLITPEPASAERGAQDAAGGASNAKSVERLAEKVYQLMLTDLRLSLARAQPLPSRRWMGR
jgi:hypothetical protein